MADEMSRQSVRRWRQGWPWMLVLMGVLVALWLAGDGATLALRYDRVPIAMGQAWRLLTAHLVHASFQHLLLNLAGLGAIALLFPAEYSPVDWLVIGLASALGIAAGLWWFDSGVIWYVGLSGVLHGWLAAGALAWWQSQPRVLAALLTGVLVTKLAYEQWRGGLGWSGDLPVIINAHLYGVVAGGLTGALLMAWRRGRHR